MQNIVDNSEPIEWFRSVIKLCNELNASDVHFEVRQDKAYLRVRRDGLMRDVKTYDETTVTQAMSATPTATRKTAHTPSQRPTRTDALLIS